MIFQSRMNARTQKSLKQNEVLEINKILAQRAAHEERFLNSNPSVVKEASNDMVKQYNYELKRILNIC